MNSLFDPDPVRDARMQSQFFLDLLKGMNRSKEILRRVEVAGLEGTAEEVYRRLNAPGHPVRDGLIMLGAGVLEEPK